ncbi:MAG TPA: acylphosphatase [Phycisphaerae bacterium]|nr:acylphosphatase [Phycisphaerales bacterium]HRX83967.1 acylphosphatase [Phycisphaerae bacterium]
MKRFTVHFSGNVQGVGFRYVTCRVADQFDVSGYVRNLADGRVEMIAEGEEGELRRFVGAVEEQMVGHIRERTIEQSPASGEFGAFGVAY